MTGTLADALQRSSLISDVTTAANGLVPVLIPLMAVFIGINLVPKLVKKFAK